MKASREPRGLARFTRTRCDEARLERQWRSIEAAGLPGAARLHKPHPIRLGVAMAGFAVAAAIGFWWLRDMPAMGLPAGAMLESEGEPITVRLPEGTSVSLLAESALRMERSEPEVIALALRTGAVRFDVVKRPNRRFSVRAETVEVIAVGTRFEVRREEMAAGVRVSVAVYEGVVEVQRTDRPGFETRLAAPERWSIELKHGREHAGEDAAQAAPPNMAEDSSDRDTAVPPVDVETTAEHSPSVNAALPSASESRKVSAVSASTSGTMREEAPSAAELFSRANVARRAGQVEEAAAFYDQLLTRYPRNPRAGLVAFELGRIRMDALSDRRGAIAAFERAISLAPDAAFVEDAMARLVLAYDGLGHKVGCDRARDRYLMRYPRGVHAARLVDRCVP